MGPQLLLLSQKKLNKPNLTKPNIITRVVSMIQYNLKTSWSYNWAEFGMQGYRPTDGRIHFYDLYAWRTLLQVSSS